MIKIQEETIHKIIQHYYPNESEQPKVRQYVQDCKEREDKKGRYIYESEELYKFSEVLLDTLSYDEFNRPEWDGEYQGKGEIYY